MFFPSLSRGSSRQESGPADSGGPARSREFLSVLFLTAVVGACLLWHAYAHPPVLGDVYEYASVARSILQSGEMREDFLRSYLDPDLPLPHPAAQRANLYPLLLLPFLRLFGQSYLTVFLPCLLSFVLLVPTVYVLGARLFGRFAGCASALLVLLHPRILNHIVFDPHPEILLTLLVLLCVHAFHLRRYVSWGIFAGLAFMTKQNAGILFPVFGLWLLLHRRNDWRRKDLWLGVLAVLAVTGPFAVRNTVLFGNPVYNETLTDMTSWSAERLKTGNMLEFLFRFRDVADEEFRVIPSTPEGALDLLAATWETTKRTLFGGYLIEYFPGFFELMCLPLVPFFLLSLRRPPGGDAGKLCCWMVFAFLAFHIVLMKGFEDRYLFPILPFAFFLSFRTMQVQCRGRRWLSPSFLTAFILVTECGPGLLANGARAAFPDSRGRESYVELRETGRWIAENTREDDVVLSSYFFSVSFYSGRGSVPYPYEDAEGLRQVLRHFGVDYVLLCDIEGGDSHLRFPRFGFLEPLFRGKTLALHRVADDQAPDEGAGNPEAYLADFNPLAEIFSRSPQHLEMTRQVSPYFRPDVPLVRYFMRFGGGRTAGVLQYGLVFLVCAFLCRRTSRFLRSLCICSGVSAAATFVLLACSQGKAFRPAGPALDPQLNRFLDGGLDAEGLGVTLIAPAGEQPLSDLLRSRFGAVRRSESFAECPPDSIVLLAPARTVRLLDGPPAIEAAHGREREEDRLYQEFKAFFEARGLRTARLSSVFAAFPPDRLR